MSRVRKQLDSIGGSPTGFWLCLAFLFLVVLAFNGKAVPFNNEYIYLLRLTPYVPTGDWSFSQAANEHWLFNTVFSIPARVFSVETIGWAGRVLVWLFCLSGLIKIARHWQISFLAVALAVCVWLAFGQSIVNAEWIFGTFEAKTVAYVCLLFALNEFSKQRSDLASVMLGLSFSFHPAVGLWAIAAVGISLLFERPSPRSLAKIIGITFIFSLPGIVPLALENSGSVASMEDWKYVVTKLMPYHFDPFYFSGLGIGVVCSMFVFNLIGLRKNGDYALRFLLRFQIVIGALFFVGFFLRWFELYSLLRFMPMRLFPIITPIFFLFTTFYLVTRVVSTPQKLLLSMLAVILVAPLSPISNGINQLRETLESHRDRPDDLRLAMGWISQNTVKDALFIAPPQNRKFWHFADRPLIASHTYPRYDRLPEWRQRIEDLTGGISFADGENAAARVEEGFSNLSESQINNLKVKYSATYLLSQAGYSFPVLFETATYKVYQLP